MTASPVDLNGLDPAAAAFLAAFRAANQELDVAALRRCFADTFLAGDSSGATVVPREAFLQALPARAAAAEQAGVGRAVLVSARAERLDDAWLLLTTGWSAPLTSGGELAMSSTFLLHDDGTDVRATVYLNHRGLPRHLGAET